jgi:hypothetical protein
LSGLFSFQIYFAFGVQILHSQRTANFTKENNMKFQSLSLSAAITLTLSTTLPDSVLAQQSPPQEAIEACSSLTEGNSCSISTPNGTISGFCALIQTQLACDPNASSGGGGNVNNELPSDIGTLIGNTNGTVPDTGQTYCYDASNAITCPDASGSFYGQDAQYKGKAMSYTNNGNGTITDNVTGLMWQQTIDRDGNGTINADDKLTYSEAKSYCQNLTLAGHTDWWLPDIKQTYSLIHFDGKDASNYSGSDTSSLTAFIDTDYFNFGYGDTDAGERIIDAQYATATQYVSTTMNGDETMFGVNFADGRIKGYGIAVHGEEKTFYVSCVRGNSNYGQNDFVDNGDGTITDKATGLMWAQNDSGRGLDWEEALAWVVQQNAANYLGHNDWRLPNVKELQSLVDYTRSPDTTNSAAIAPSFNASPIINESGKSDYPYYWSSTTHVSYSSASGANAAYLSFGRAIGSMDSAKTWIDVHGAGSQRSDPKTGNAADYPKSHGPQGDAQRVFNYVRLVRDAGTTTTSPTNTAYLTNISTRANLSGGVNDPIAGFIIEGSGTQQIIIRGSALDNGVDPALSLFKHNGTSWDTLANNDEWEMDSNANAVSALSTGLQLSDLNGNDAALLRALAAGVYTAVLSSNGEAGLALVSVDSTDTSVNNPTLINISTRANVSGGTADPIAGFIIKGSGTLPIIIRGIALDSGVDPALTLFKHNGTDWESVAVNDEWENDTQASAVSALAASLQLPDQNGNDAGLLRNLEAGVYTVLLSSKGSAGLALVGINVVN